MAEDPVSRVEGQHAGGDPQERRFSRTVGPGESNPFAAQDFEVDARVDGDVAVALVERLEGKDALARASGLRQPEAHVLAAVGLELDAFDALEGLETALGLTSLRRLGAEALDESFHLGDLTILVCLARKQLLAARNALAQVIVVVAFVERGAA